MWRSELHYDFRRPDQSGLSLRERLLELEARIAELVPPEKRAVTEAAIAEITQSGAGQQALAVGAKAPEFELPDSNGKPVRSADFLARGKLAVVFFRGRWCPYCVAQIEMLNEFLPRLRAQGTELVAISPQTVQQSGFMASQHKLAFPLLSDAGNCVARSFGLVYRLPGPLMEQYKRTFINLPHVNGDASWELPVPASFVLGRDATVLYRDLCADWRQRPEPAELLGI